ncbi:MFS transporter, partial [Blautia pseudococcoides]|nr:MFS transporter [Blautia pseudococcoides]
MTSLLLIIIYLAFISLGLPDSLLGSAWPSMYQELGASVSWAGIITMIIAAGTIVSSLASDHLTRKLGAGKVTAISVGMTAVALFGFSISNSFWLLCLWAVPYGLGAGSVDAALNNFVALHYPARHMSWLHCMWGLGASIGPVVMGWAVAGGLKWNGGYQTISIMQVVLTAVLIFSLPLWRKMQKSHAAKTGDDSEVSEKNPGRHYTLTQLVKLRGVKEVLICFFCYCALESTAGIWAASYCTLYHGISPERAARWASLFYMGITAGRFVCGFITMKVNDRNMIRLGQVVTAVGIVCILLPIGGNVLFAGLILVGCGCAPIYPSIIHETPINFGADLSQSVIGVQMAAAYVGTCLVPPLFGLIA